MNLGNLVKDRRIVLFIIIIFSLVLMSFISPYFLNSANLLSLLRYSTVVGLIALAQTPIILGGGGGIDLSVGSSLSLSSVVFGLLSTRIGLDPWLAALFTLLISLLFGLFNGLLITIIQVPPLIVTLGSMYLFSSAAMVLSGGKDLNGFDSHHFAFLGQGLFLGVPSQVFFVLIPIFIIFSYVMKRSIFGRHVYAIGSSAEAARLAGINVTKIKISLYVLSSFLASIGAIVTASWLLNARPTAGSELLLPSITIAVLGGIVITGGVGTVFGTFLALLLVAILNSGMQLAGINSTFQIGLLGIVLLFSILIRSKDQASKVVV
jgi:ribose/xylose/arabinose/galactoside ABC-type transport system permease subunit